MYEIDRTGYQQFELWYLPNLTAQRLAMGTFKTHDAARQRSLVLEEYRGNIALAPEEA